MKRVAFQETEPVKQEKGYVTHVTVITTGHRMYTPCKNAARSDPRQVNGYITLGAKVKAQLEFPSVPLAIDNSPDTYR